MWYYAYASLVRVLGRYESWGLACKGESLHAFCLPFGDSFRCGVCSVKVVRVSSDVGTDQGFDVTLFVVNL